MTIQPNERASASLRLAAPGLGFGLDDDEIGAFLDATSKGLLIPETSCDKGMQDNYALRAEATVTVSAETGTPSAS
ncbi:hypothetical protein [Actinomadura sp. SCN-SB]|uniref:hypothetical protein n=1 Tax=Actinomadura sp. SCN-SB TaxID=3373092 RepID=UPI003751EBD1